MKHLFTVAIAALVVCSSCREIFAKRLRGNGNITTQTRSAGQFTGVDVSGSIDVHVKQDSNASIKVEADDNLQQYIETVIDGNTLHIRPREGYNLNSSRQIIVYVSSPVMARFEASGACNIIGDTNIRDSSQINVDLSGSCDATLDISAPKVMADLSGACTLTLKGQTKEFNIQGSGSTDLKCFDLLAENVDLDISGAGNAEVFAGSKLTGDISGSADVRYKGNAQTDIHTSGASSVRKAD